jgi:hypothetical protein
MKKFLFSLITIFSLVGSTHSEAQSFSIEKDTVRLVYSYTTGGMQMLRDSIIPTGSVTLTWKVASCNFPANWLSAGSPGMCDNKYCYNFSGATGIWPGGPGATEVSNPYSATGTRDFHLQLNLSSTAITTYGTYYCVVNATGGSTDTNMVFAVTLNAPNAVQNVTKTEDILLYPNPCTNDINIVFDGEPDVKTIAVYNNIGRMVSIYKVSGTSANINLENVQSGIYFVRLMNSQGMVVNTRKFTKQ